MTNTEQRIQALIEMLSRDARTDEDKARAESMRKNWMELARSNAFVTTSRSC